jgi:outer membrane protein OmpA-like peptidoglycan-associated protein
MDGDSRDLRPICWWPLLAALAGMLFSAWLVLGRADGAQGSLNWMREQSQTKADAALAAAGHSWAKLDMGRDGVARIVGAPPSAEAAKEALKTVRATLQDRIGFPGVAFTVMHADKLGGVTQIPPTGPTRPIDPVDKPEPKPAPAKPIAAAPAVPAAPPAKPAATPAAAGALDARACRRELATIAGGGIRFATDSSLLSARAQRALDQVAALSARCPTQKLVTTGHTDRRGSAAYNQALSERRAQAVITYLAAKGVSEAALQAVGRGEAQPVSRRNTANAFARNRRITLAFEDR